MHRVKPLNWDEQREASTATPRPDQNNGCIRWCPTAPSGLAPIPPRSLWIILPAFRNLTMSRLLASLSLSSSPTLPSLLSVRGAGFGNAYLGFGRCRRTGGRYVSMYNLLYKEIKCLLSAFHLVLFSFCVLNKKCLGTY